MVMSTRLSVASSSGQGTAIGAAMGVAGGTATVSVKNLSIVVTDAQMAFYGGQSRVHLHDPFTDDCARPKD